jgi:uncharacterized protein YgiM (DUF1202 family)
MILTIFLLPGLVACNLSTGSKAVDQNANATATAIFQTLDAQSAELTAQPGSQPQVPAVTEQPPAQTQPPAGTQPAAQNQPTAAQPAQGTAASGAATVIATVNTNCRSGPDKTYPKVSNLGATLRATIQGKDATGTWWYVQNTKKVSGSCWVSADTVKVEGDTSNLPVIQAISLDAARTQEAQTVEAPVGAAPVKTVKPTATP